MAPPPAATATATRRHAAGAAASAAPRRAGRGTEAPSTRRAPLRVVPTRSRRGIRGGRTAAGRGRLLTVVSVCMVVAALLAVVVGQALLANGQVKLSALQHELTLEQSAHSLAELAVAQLETPARIVAAATRGWPGRAGQRHRAALRLTVRAPPHPEGDARTRSNPADNSSAGAGAPAGTGTRQHLCLFVYVRRDNDTDVDAVSVTTRQEPDRARWFRPPERRQDDVDPAARPAQPARRPARPGSPGPPGSARAPSTRRPSPPRRRGGLGRATRPRQRPHRPPAKVARLPLSRQRRGWESGTFSRRVRLVRMVLLVAMLLLVARLVDVQVLRSGSYQAAAARGVLHLGLPRLAARRHLRPRRIAAGGLRRHR